MFCHKIDTAAKVLGPLKTEEEKLQGEYEEQQKHLKELQQAREEFKKVEAEIPLLRRSQPKFSESTILIARVVHGFR